ncbi:MAG: hypothetical protein HC818_03345 [Synechococcaceae cyanobacterium RM1_1_27]|nr:hypothetical protein [Synechococcaceae cyanobacterium RM1_1_27]
MEDRSSGWGKTKADTEKTTQRYGLHDDQLRGIPGVCAGGAECVAPKVGSGIVDGMDRDPVVVGGDGAIAAGDGLKFPPVVGMPSGRDGLILMTSRFLIEGSRRL